MPRNCARPRTRWEETPKARRRYGSARVRKGGRPRPLVNLVATTLPPAKGAPMNPAPTPDERIDAIEEFLAQLVLLLEVEPNLTKDTVTNWLQLGAAAMRAHKTKSPRQQAVFG